MDGAVVVLIDARCEHRGQPRARPSNVLGSACRLLRQRDLHGAGTGAGAGRRGGGDPRPRPPRLIPLALTLAAGEQLPLKELAEGAAAGEVARPVHARPQRRQVGSRLVGEVPRSELGGREGVGCRGGRGWGRAGQAKGGCGAEQGRVRRRPRALLWGSRCEAPGRRMQQCAAPRVPPSHARATARSPFFKPTLPLLCGRHAISCTVMPLGHLSPWDCRGEAQGTFGGTGVAHNRAGGPGRRSSCPGCKQGLAPKRARLNRLVNQSKRVDLPGTLQSARRWRRRRRPGPCPAQTGPAGRAAPGLRCAQTRLGRSRWTSGRPCPAAEEAGWEATLLAG